MNQDFRVSYNALRKIYSQEAYSNIAMNEALEDGKNCSPGFVRYVVKEILRRSMALDYVIAGLCRNGLRGMKSRTKVLLRLGIFLLNASTKSWSWPAPWTDPIVVLSTASSEAIFGAVKK